MNRPTREEVDKALDEAKKLVDANERTLVQRIDDIDTRQDRFRDDLKDAQNAISHQIRDSETRVINALVAAIKR